MTTSSRSNAFLKAAAREIGRGADQEVIALAHLRTALVLLTHQNEKLGRLLTIVIDRVFVDATGGSIGGQPHPADAE